MEKKTILFVDDENEVLKSLERSLINESFNSLFASNVDDAIKILNSEQVNILISDMRMPVKDGTLLFEYAKLKFPSLPRIALSGYTDEKRVINLIEKNLIKYYILKPWKVDELISIINKILFLEDKLNDSNLLAIVNNIESLPTLPEIYKTISKMIEQGDGLENIANELKKDQSLASKVLRVVNSGFYALKTDSIDHAVTFLGSNITKSIILSNEIFYKKSNYMFLQELIWKHSEIVGRNMNTLVSHLNQKPVSTHSSAALFHDIGMVVLLNEYGEKYKEILVSALRDPNINLLDAEREAFEITHQEIGGLLLNWWEFPYSIIEATMYHHDPLHLETINSQLVEILYVADIFSWNEVLKLKKRCYNINATVLFDLDLNEKTCFELLKGRTL